MPLRLARQVARRAGDAVPAQAVGEGAPLVDGAGGQPGLRREGKRGLALQEEAEGLVRAIATGLHLEAGRQQPVPPEGGVALRSLDDAAGDLEMRRGRGDLAAREEGHGGLGVEHGRGPGPARLGGVDPPREAGHGFGGPGDEHRDGVLGAAFGVVLQQVFVEGLRGPGGTRERERLVQLLGPARDLVLEPEREVVVARLEAAQRHGDELGQPALGQRLDRGRRSLPRHDAAGTHDGEPGRHAREARQSGPASRRRPGSRSRGPRLPRTCVAPGAGRAAPEAWDRPPPRR